MKVYELMNALASLPSGADIMCSATLTVSELEAGGQMGKDEYDEIRNSLHFSTLQSRISAAVVLLLVGVLIKKGR